MTKSNFISSTLISAVIGFVAVITFSLCYWTKIKIDEATKPLSWDDVGITVKWNSVAHWVGQLPPHLKSQGQEIYPVLVHSAEEMALLPVGTWVMTDEGVIGRVKTQAISMEEYRKIDPARLRKWEAEAVE